MLIPTYYLLSKIWDIFATRRRILLEINKNYFRRSEVNNSLHIKIVQLAWAARFFCNHVGIWISQDIKEDGDDACIDQISEHSANDWNDEEWLDGITVFVTYSTHVGHSIGGCTKAETTHSCTQNGSIIIAA